jgi:tyrosyl-tRNA synthetase
LRKNHDVSLQVGGSDQWGNIVAGVYLTRRLHGEAVFGLTTPLITKSDGGKFGKTEQGAIWLTPDLTSPYAFYQFWLNAADGDVGRFLRIFSLRPLDEVEQLIAAQMADPATRVAQRALAEELTALLHGDDGLRGARLATEALFSGNVQQLPKNLLDDLFAGAPTTELSPALLAAPGLSAVDLVITCELAKNKREARQHLTSGAVSLNGTRIDETFLLTGEHLLFGRLALLRKGKKTWHVCRFSGS